MSATSFGMILVHLQHTFQQNSIDIFSYTPFKIIFSAVLFLATIMSIGMGYVVSQEWASPTLSVIVGVEICRFLNSVVTLMIVCSKSRTEDTYRSKIGAHNQFLLKTYQILAKLNSCAYLIHVTVAKLILGMLILTNQFNQFVFLVFSLVFSYILALFLFLFVEQPILNLCKYLQKAKKN